jgi:ribosomal protein S18 acetylase RimI-like enzyme
MIRYRDATSHDALAIAHLHATSWQENYKGIWKDEFLEGKVFENRLEVWKHRLGFSDETQKVILAEWNGQICGFACTYLNKDMVWGSYLDNLHVAKDFKGQGIGKNLMSLAAAWVTHHNPDSGFYLYVLEKNEKARRFYDHLGAISAEVVSIEYPPGNFSDNCRYVWPHANALVMAK